MELSGRVILLAAWWSLLRLLTHQVHAFDTVDDAFALINLPAGPSLFSVVLLFIVGGAVRRRMRGAWWLLLGFQIVAAVYTLSLLTGLAALSDLPGAVDSTAAVATTANSLLTVVVVVLLLRCRPAFTSLVEPGARGRVVAVLAGGLMLSIATSIALTVSAPNRLRDTAHELQWAIRVVFGSRPDRSDIGWAGQYGHWWVASIAGVMSGLTLIAAAVVFVRSARAKEHLSAQDELAIRGLLVTHGGHDSLGYFATRRDKSVIFARHCRAAITYRVVANVSLASADPLGAQAHWPEAISEWLRETRSHGWFPAVLGAGEAGAKAYVAAGLKTVPIGDEAVIDTETFTLDGPRMQPVRRAARRIRRLGYTITVHRHADLDAAQLAHLARCAKDWRVDETERGFSMALGRLCDPLDGRCVAVLAHDSAGQLRGLLSLVPWGQRGLSLDLMRRDPCSDNGLNEAMVATLVRHARDELGVARISLNFAMFRGVFGAAERVGARPLVRMTSRIMHTASRFWQIESLYRSNARYQPRWETRYLCYDSLLTLTRVSVAAGSAEGFLPTLGGRPVERPRDEHVIYSGARLPLTVAVPAQDAALSQGAACAQRPSQQQRARLDKLELLRQHGLEPYPAIVPHDSTIAEFRRGCPPLVADQRTGRTVSIVGRIRALRHFGGLIFVVLQEDAATIQAMLTIEELGERHELAHRVLDLGDLLSVTGEIVVSRSGELSVLVRRWQMAAKCLTPVPKIRPSAVDGRRTSRQRQVELIVDGQARQLLELRSAAVGALRASLLDRGYLEVETPVLQPVHGGANARPFITHMHAHDIPLYLRIAPELHLKRLCVAGLSRLFELSRNFRNEGVDDTHNPEFTSLEAYQAYADYRDMQQVARDLVLDAAVAMHGTPIARRRLPGGRVLDVDLSGQWAAVSVHDAVSKACHAEVTPDTDRGRLSSLCRDNGIPIRSDATTGELVIKLYEHLVESRTSLPTFYYDFPLESSPLTRAHRTESRLAERWDLVAWGQEIGTAYSELNDPLDQRRRLTDQSLRRAVGDAEAMQVDEDFLTALGYGMPPTGGLGLGVERLLMMLTSATIHETLTFPFATRASVPDDDHL